MRPSAKAAGDEKIASYTFPTSAELLVIEQEFTARLEENRFVFSFFPKNTVDAHLVKWEQKDNYLGLAQVRGLNGEPMRVKRIGHKQYLMAPGVYGEYVVLDEQELTTRRQIGTFADPISLDDLVVEAQEQLLQRELDRIEKIIWDLLVAGTFSVAGPMGTTLHSDSYSNQTFTATTPWATVATATPIKDLRSIQLLSRGKGVNFGSQSQAIMNRTTANSLFANTNASDLGGKKSNLGGSITGPDDVNRILTQEDLPQIVIWDQGYADDTGTFQLFIPNAKVVVVGQRPGNQNVGEYRFTRNVNNEAFAPGPYTRVIDTLVENGDVPRKMIVHRGHNGGAVIFYPGAIVSASV